MAAHSLIIERALAQVGEALRDAPDSRDFIRHRARHASDAAIARGLHDGSTLLEIGSAPGYFTALLQLPGIPAVGVDLAPQRMGYQVIVARKVRAGPALAALDAASE